MQKSDVFQPKVKGKWNEFLKVYSLEVDSDSSGAVLIAFCNGRNEIIKAVGMDVQRGCNAVQLYDHQLLLPGSYSVVVTKVYDSKGKAHQKFKVIFREGFTTQDTPVFRFRLEPVNV